MNTDVAEAFQRLLEAMQQVEATLGEQGAEHFRRGDDDAGRRALNKAKRLIRLRSRAARLGREWAAFDAPRGRARKRRERRPGSGLRAARTPQEAFRVPIPQALIEPGGQASAAVLDRVEQTMAARFTAADRSPLPSSPHAPRWRNTAQWCRLALVRAGWLECATPRGTWAMITAAGRRWLAERAGD